MNYKKEVNPENFEKALGLEKHQVTRIDNAISKAYNQQFHKDGANQDQIIAFVAPYIKTQEEAFYAATAIVMNHLYAMEKHRKTLN